MAFDWGGVVGSAIGAGASIFGGERSNEAARSNFEDQVAFQREFAQHGIRWRVDDARAAGIHPLYALGAQTHQFHPVSMPQFDVYGGAAGHLAQFGQDITRAIDGTRTNEEKIEAYSDLMADKNLKRADLENDLLAAQIARLTRGPGFPSGDDNDFIMGQGDVTGRYGVRVPTADEVQRLVQINPMQVTASEPGQPHQEAGSIPGLGWERTPTGWAPLPSKDAKERMEDMTIPEWAWALRTFGAANTGELPTPFAAPDGKFWKWNVFRQEYQLKDVPSYDDPGEKPPAPLHAPARDPKRWKPRGSYPGGWEGHLQDNWFGRRR